MKKPLGTILLMMGSGEEATEDDSLSSLSRKTLFYHTFTVWRKVDEEIESAETFAGKHVVTAPEKI